MPDAPSESNRKRPNNETHRIHWKICGVCKGEINEKRKMEVPRHTRKNSINITLRQRVRGGAKLVELEHTLRILFEFNNTGFVC
jgi:hypothetical protein